MLCGCAKMLRNWAMLSKPQGASQLEEWARLMERRGVEPSRLPWKLEHHRSTEFTVVSESGSEANALINVIDMVIDTEMLGLNNV
jgi:hypothetical protein